MRSTCLELSSNLLNEVSSLFWYFEVRVRTVRYRRKKVHVRYLISWWVLVYTVISFPSFSMLPPHGLVSALQRIKWGSTPSSADAGSLDTLIEAWRLKTWHCVLRQKMNSFFHWPKWCCCYSWLADADVVAARLHWVLWFPATSHQSHQRLTCRC